MFLPDAGVKALRSLWNPAMLGVVFYTVLLTLLALIGLFIATSALAWHVSMAVHMGWVSGLIALGGGIGSAILAWMLFPAIMPIVVSFFDNRIADVIENRDYPERPKAAPIAFWPEILHDVGFSFWAVFLNIVCLPLYLVPGLNLVLFYALNGYLLGREFFDMAARRHMPRAQAQALRKAFSGQIFLGGVVLVLLASIPIVNLIAPFWGVALATHLFHQVYKPDIAIPYRADSISRF